MHKHSSETSNWIVISIVLLFTVVCIGGLGALWYVRVQVLQEKMKVYERQAIMAQQQALHAQKQAELARRAAEMELKQQQRLLAAQQAAAVVTQQPTPSTDGDEPLLPPLETLPEEF